MQIIVIYVALILSRIEKWSMRSFECCLTEVPISNRRQIFSALGVLEEVFSFSKTPDTNEWLSTRPSAKLFCAVIVL